MRKEILRLSLIWCLILAGLPAPMRAQIPTTKTTVSDLILNPDSSPRSGKVTFILTQAATSPEGLISASASVSAALDNTGRFTVKLYPSVGLSPQSYYQCWFAASGSLNRELIGLYAIPVSSAVVTLAPYKVTDTALVARYVFADQTSVNNLATNAGTAGGIAGAAAAMAALTSGISDQALPRWDSASGKFVNNSGGLNSLPLNNGDGSVTWVNKDDIAFQTPGTPIVQGIPVAGSTGRASLAEVQARTDTSKIVTADKIATQRGKLRVLAIASLPTTTYTDGATVEDGDKAQLIDNNRVTVTYRSALGRWVKDDTTFRPERFGAVSGGSAATNNPAFVAMFAAVLANGGGVVDLGGSENSYSVSQSFAIPSNTTIQGGQATLTQTATQTAIFNVNSTSNVKIEKVKFVGKGTDFIDSPSSLARAITGTTSVAGLKVKDCTFTNFASAGMFIGNISDFELVGNTIVGIGTAGGLVPGTSGGCYGIALNSNAGKGLIQGNIISETAMGIASGDVMTDVRAIGNTIFNIRGQHAIYFSGALTNVLIDSTTVNNVSLQGIKVQNNNASGAHNQNVIINNSTIKGAGSQSILVTVAAWPATWKNYNVSVTNSTILDGGEDGINVTDCIGCSIGGVTNIRNIAREGISMYNTVNLQIISPNITLAGANGIREVDNCLNTTIKGAKITNAANLSITTDKNGIKLHGGTGHVLEGNEIRDDAARQQYGIYVETGAQNTFTIRNNIIPNATDYAIRFKSGEGLALYGGNQLAGTLGATLNLPTTDQRGDTGRIFYSTAVPSSGTWERGDIVKNYTPSANGIVMWVNVATGAPGGWTTVYANNQPTDSTSSPTFNNVTLTSSSATTLLSATSDTPVEADVATFSNPNAGGYTGVIINRSSTARYALHKYKTAGVTDWMAGVASNGGGANSEYSIGTGIALTDAKFRLNSSGRLWAMFMQIGSVSGPTWTSGTGSPEGVLTAPIGSFYSRTDGGAGTSWYVKESGAGNTGWIAK